MSPRDIYEISQKERARQQSKSQSKSSKGQSRWSKNVFKDRILNQKKKLVLK